MTPAGMSEPNVLANKLRSVAVWLEGEPQLAAAIRLPAIETLRLSADALADITSPAVVPEPARQSVLDEVRRAIRALWGVAPGPHAILDLADVESVIDRLAAPAAVREPAPSFPAVPPSEEKKP